MITRVLLIASLVLGVGAGCEKTNDESIEKWRRTEKGPGKLKATLQSTSIDPSLSAHAAAVMIDMGQDGAVRAEFEAMPAERRTAVLQKLAPRLWEAARIQREDALPVGQQIVAKDQLIAFRKYADDALKTQIDGYLLDWYGVISYEARAKAGAVLGSTAMRLIGPAGGKKLVTVLNGLIAAPGQEVKKNRIGDELMLGIAASGDPDGVKRLLEVAHLDRADPTLSRRAMDALHQGYVDPGGLFDMQDNAPLKPNLGALLDVARDDAMAGQPADTAIELIRRIGPPDCQDALVGLIGMPHPSIKFRYATAQSALICGGAKAVLPVIQALPEGPYMKDELVGAVVSEIAKQSPRADVQASLRQALGDKSVIARWVAIEALARMKSTEDQSKIAALSASKEKLVGYWGDQSNLDAAARKSDPTLGDRAKELADLVGKGEVPK